MKPHRSRTASDAGRILAVVRAARDVPGGVRYDLDLARAWQRIPAIAVIPHAHAPVPAALLLHGLGSRKERMSDTIGDALVRRGVAALAVDLPLHGGREGTAGNLKSPDRLFGAWSDAVTEARVALQYLGTHDAIDARRLAIVGYSLGSFLANVVAADSPDVRALVLAASGDLPDGLPFESLVRAVVDPLRAVARAAGRPMLMINGRFDRTVKPSQAERLFAAAREPKTMRWYSGGHWPPESEIEHAALWLAAQLHGKAAARREA
jgi:dienelactone hydrolase